MIKFKLPHPSPSGSNGSLSAKGKLGENALKMIKTLITAATLLLPATLNHSRAAQPEPLGAIWRQGLNDKTVFIVGTMRSTADLDQLSAAENHPQPGSQKPLHDVFLRLEALCSEDDFSVRVKANSVEQESPEIKNRSPYSFEDSPLRETSITVNDASSLNLRYLWGQMSGASINVDDRRNLAGSLYRFLTAISERPKNEIKLFTPNGSTAYLLDKSYQEAANADAIKAFKEKCGTFVNNWH